MVFFIFWHLEFTPHKAEQTLQGIELHKKENVKQVKHTQRLVKDSPKM